MIEETDSHENTLSSCISCVSTDECVTKEIIVEREEKKISPSKNKFVNLRAYDWMIKCCKTVINSANIYRSKYIKKKTKFTNLNKYFSIYPKCNLPELNEHKLIKENNAIDFFQDSLNFEVSISNQAVSICKSHKHSKTLQENICYKLNFFERLICYDTFSKEGNQILQLDETFKKFLRLYKEFDNNLYRKTVSGCRKNRNAQMSEVEKLLTVLMLNNNMRVYLKPNPEDTFSYDISENDWNIDAFHEKLIYFCSVINSKEMQYVSFKPKNAPTKVPIIESSLSVSGYAVENVDVYGSPIEECINYNCDTTCSNNAIHSIQNNLKQPENSKSSVHIISPGVKHNELDIKRRIKFGACSTAENNLNTSSFLSTEKKESNEELLNELITKNKTVSNTLRASENQKITMNLVPNTPNKLSMHLSPHQPYACIKQPSNPDVPISQERFLTKLHDVNAEFEEADVKLSKRLNMTTENEKYKSPGHSFCKYINASNGTQIHSSLSKQAGNKGDVHVNRKRRRVTDPPVLNVKRVYHVLDPRYILFKEYSLSKCNILNQENEILSFHDVIYRNQFGFPAKQDKMTETLPERGNYD